jgi:hypothetical protein
MGKINLKGVIIGGLVAGVVLNVFDYVLFGVVLRNDMAAAMQALNQPPMSDSVIPWYVFVDFLFGIFLVWLYAAVRPRFGAGPSTAIKAGLIAWVAFNVLRALYDWPEGMMPHNILVIVTLVALVKQPLASVVGAKFYTEM